jgi:flagellar biosynthesis chaperone FliJ
MKNYRALVKLRQQQFDRAEQALARANARLRALRRERERIRAQMREIDVPPTGTGNVLNGVLQNRRTMMAVVERLDRQIEAARMEVLEKERALQAAHVALEQAKSIEADALKKILDRQKRKQRNDLDEIASQGFWRRRANVGEFG